MKELNKIKELFDAFIQEAEGIIKEQKEIELSKRWRKLLGKRKK